MSGRRAIVVGLARTGLAAAALLHRHGWSVAFSERRPEERLDPADVAHAAAAGWARHCGGHRVEVLAACDLVVLSPGVPAGLPELDACRARGIPVIGEVELARRHLPGTLVTVTGTKGKSSTVAVLSGILEAAGIDHEVGGHAGQPLSACDPARQVIVAELACYQMEALDAFTPDIHVVTNVMPDHQDRYPDFRDYFDLKVRLCRAQGPAQACVLPGELRAWAARAGVRSRVATFAPAPPAAAGAGCWYDAQAGEVVHRDGDSERRYRHDASVRAGNLENVLAAVAAARALGVDDAAIAAALREPRALRHRCETIRDDGRVRIVDDSACNNEAALAHVIGRIPGPVRVLTLGEGRPPRAAGGRVRLVRLAREGLAQSLGPALRAQLADLPPEGGTILWAPAVPIAAADPAAYLELFAAAVAGELGGA